MRNEARRRGKRPSKTDLELLSILWERGTATAREIHQDLIDKGVIRRNVAYTTIRTYLDRLIHKGFAASEEIGDNRGTLRYHPSVSRDDLRDDPDLLERIVTILGLRPADFLRWFYEQGKLSKRDVQRLDMLLKEIPDSALPPGSQAGE
jgi:predicted transcriptional regulator